MLRVTGIAITTQITTDAIMIGLKIVPIADSTMLTDGEMAKEDLTIELTCMAGRVL